VAVELEEIAAPGVCGSCASPGNGTIQKINLFSHRARDVPKMKFFIICCFYRVFSSGWISGEVFPGGGIVNGLKQFSSPSAH
jgi:hypothetical protein